MPLRGAAVGRTGRYGAQQLPGRGFNAQAATPGAGGGHPAWCAPPPKPRPLARPHIR